MGDVQLAVDGAKVRMHGPRAEKELVSNLRIGETVSEQTEDLDLSVGQAAQAGPTVSLRRPRFLGTGHA